MTVVKRLVADVNVNHALEKMLVRMLADHGTFTVNIANAEGTTADTLFEKLLHDRLIRSKDATLKNYYIALSALQVQPITSIVAAPYAKLLQAVGVCNLLMSTHSNHTFADVETMIESAIDLKKDGIISGVVEQMIKVSPQLSFYAKSLLSPRDVITIPLTVMASQVELEQLRLQLSAEVLAQFNTVYAAAVPPRTHIPEKSQLERDMLQQSLFKSKSSLFRALETYVVGSPTM